MKDIQVGIVGYGLAGRAFHGRLIAATEGMELAVIATSAKERAAQATADHPRAALVNGFDDLLRHRGLDLVVLATPHDTHAPLAIRALEAGVAVVTDKIMCLSVSEADAMIAASVRAQRLLSVFQNRRWDSDFLTLRALLAAGYAGDPVVIESTVVRAGPDSSPAPKREERPWRQRADRGGGPLRDWGAHLIDQALILGGGLPRSVHCVMHHRRPGLDVETLASCTLQFASGLCMRIEAGGHSFLPKPRWYVQGTLGSVQMDGLDPQEAHLRAGEVTSGTARASFDRARIHVAPAPAEELMVHPGDYAAYYANVRDTLRGSAELAVTPESCRDGLRVLEAALRSAQTDQVVRLLGER